MAVRNDDADPIVHGSRREHSTPVRDEREWASVRDWVNERAAQRRGLHLHTHNTHHHYSLLVSALVCLYCTTVLGRG